MSEDVYRKLAQRLDATPNGFTPTESGVELRMLAKLFAPHEAELAAVMRMSFEPASDIAARVSVDPKMAYRTLKRMVRKGLIYTQKGKGQLLFGLMPFAVGFYEEQLSTIDVELAELFEQYYQETQGGGSLVQVPAIHRVIPITEAIPADVEISPYEQAIELLEEAKAWGVRDCLCRIQQRLIGQPCDHPIENCMVFAPVEGAFDYNKDARAITKQEALRVLQEAAEAGLVHSVANHRDGHYYICNCCTCSCGALRSVTEFGNLTAVSRSNFRAVVDEDECIACGDCVEACQFGALSVPEDVCVVDSIRCMGCGICTTSCPTDALSLERLPEVEALPLADDIEQWRVQRLKERRLPAADIL
jgi:ferredoxin